MLFEAIGSLDPRDSANLFRIIAQADVVFLVTAARLHGERFGTDKSPLGGFSFVAEWHRRMLLLGNTGRKSGRAPLLG